MRGERNGKEGKRSTREIRREGGRGNIHLPVGCKAHL